MRRMLLIRKDHIRLHILFVVVLFSLGSESVHENANTIVRCIEKERQALLMFKRGIVDKSGRLSSWGSEEDKKDCCMWYGVECSDVTGHVTSLDFYPPFDIKINMTSSLIELKSLNYLTLTESDFGRMPIPNFIGSLTSLVSLDLSHSNLSGPIPSSIGSLTSLVFLNLADNNLNGPILYQLGNLSNLKYLYLRYNEGLYVKDGNLEWLSRLSSLTDLHLSGVDLSRANGWVDIIKALPFLQKLSLDTCNLSRVITPSLSSTNSSSFISNLNLSSNDLTFSTSHWLFNLSSSLVELYLSHNQFTMPLIDFKGWPFLERLDLSSNQLAGPLHEFKGWPSLYYLDISHNQLTALLPETFGQLANLGDLDISKNSLQDVITKEHFSNFSHLWSLDLSFNTNISFNWSSRHVSRGLQRIIFLLMSSCKLGPRFPEWIKSQKSLSFLDLSNNEISDSIPTWFWDLNSEMGYLNLSSNKIRGILPNINSAVYELDLSSNNLEGPIPSFLANGTSLNLSKNKFSDTCLSCKHRHLGVTIS